MKGTKKKSPARIYLTFAAIILTCALVGALVGYVVLDYEFSLLDFSQQFNHALSIPGPYWFAPTLLLLCISTWCYFRGRGYIPSATENDHSFTKANRLLTYAMTMCNISGACMFLAMALSYSASWGLGISILLLIVHLVWMTTMQALIVSATKRISPEKQGNIFDLKFQHDWYQSCDEAEQQQIGQCSYQTFKVMSLIFPGIMAVLALLSVINLVAPTYSLLVGGIWLVQQLVYHYTAIQMDKKRG